MHCEKLKALMKIRSFWWKESCSLKIKVFEVLLCHKDKTYDESASYVWKLSDTCSFWNVKFYDYESYNIFRENVYKERFSYWVKMFLV